MGYKVNEVVEKIEGGPIKKALNKPGNWKNQLLITKKIKLQNFQSGLVGT